MSKFLIAGLGNIGTEYAGTRHNIGFDIADALVRKMGGSFRNDRLADVAELKWKGRILIIIKPTTYMNLSGKAVKYWMDSEFFDHAVMEYDNPTHWMPLPTPPGGDK